MSTNDIALERVQALLKVDTGNGSLYEHLVRVCRKLTEDRPEDALAQLETLSRHLKQSTFKGARGPDASQDIVRDAEASAKQKKWCQDIGKLLQQFDHPESPIVLQCTLRNVDDDARMFSWAGIGFGQQETFHLSMSLRKLAMETPGLLRLRFWGKILGTGGDYYIAEGAMEVPKVERPPPPALPGTPDYDVEPLGEGSNIFVYWVTGTSCSSWVRLPSARASHILAAQNIKKLMTGNLESPILSSPWFPGKERHLLRAQIARISASCTLAVKGWLVEDEDLPGRVKEAEDREENFPGHDELETQGAWVHALPHLLATGKIAYPDLDKIRELVQPEDEPKRPSALPQEVFDKLEAEVQNQQELEPQKGLLEGIEEDLVELKAEDAPEGSPAWSIRKRGDQGLYTFDDDTKSYRVTVLSSKVWPGAVTVAQGKKFSNIYVGYGLKCGSLLPADPKSGLPLAHTSPFMPLAPGDIMEEPVDLEENEEPNPQDEDAQSDHASVDPDDEAD